MASESSGTFQTHEEYNATKAARPKTGEEEIRDLKNGWANCAASLAAKEAECEALRVERDEARETGDHWKKEAYGYNWQKAKTDAIEKELSAALASLEKFVVAHALANKRAEAAEAEVKRLRKALDEAERVALDTVNLATVIPSVEGQNPAALVIILRRELRKAFDRLRALANTQEK